VDGRCAKAVCVSGRIYLNYHRNTGKVVFSTHEIACIFTFGQAQNNAMPEISRFFGIIIRMYFGDHNPPHFHAIYQEFTAEYDIQTLEVIIGGLPSRAHSMVL
jgi:hypothetical protein